MKIDSELIEIAISRLEDMQKSGEILSEDRENIVSHILGFDSYEDLCLSIGKEISLKNISEIPLQKLENKTLAALLQGCDDSLGYFFWIDNEAVLHIEVLGVLDPEAFEEECDTLKVRFEVMQKGEGNVGMKAAKNINYLEDEVKIIKNVWEQCANRNTKAYYSDGFLF
jgi:hypothetical protein